jgi:hypothetical protein
MLEYPDQVAMDNLKLKMAQGAARYKIELSSRRKILD